MMNNNRLSAVIERVKIAGFRSFKDVDIRLSNLTVMIGANGAGKSNFMHFFHMISWMLISHKLEGFIERFGGADDQLFFGNKVTPRLTAEIELKTNTGRSDYKFDLSYAHPDRLVFTDEAFRYSKKDSNLLAKWQHLGSTHREAELLTVAYSNEDVGLNKKTARMIADFLKNCGTYQFHDTSEESFFNKRWDIDDNNYLKSHGGNLAAILYRLEREDIKRYTLICRQITRILPVFETFVIQESFGKVSLRWKGKWSDKTFGAHLTSDGSLRFFALVTLLNLPSEMLPDVIMLDEPELGLHPSAIALIAELIRALSEKKQVIIATQSPLFVDAFNLSNIIALDMESGATKFTNLNPDNYKLWLDQDFTPGELWQKNLLGGRP